MMDKKILMFALLAIVSTLINFVLLLERNATLDRLRQSSSSISSLSNQLQQQENMITNLEKKLQKPINSSSLLQSNKLEKQNLFINLLQEYSQLHNDIMKGNVALPKFVTCSIINGWGNAIQEALSCFIFAFVSKRAIIFNTHGLEGYMPWKDYMKLPFDGYNTDILFGKSRLIITRHNLTCFDFSSFENEELVEVIVTYDWYFPNILTNPHHGEELWKILPENYFEILFNYLFKIDENVLRRVRNFVRSEFSEYTVGIQIRHPSLSKTSGKKDHKGFPVPPINLFCQVADQLSRFQTEEDYSKTRWFVATQNLDIIMKLKERYGKERIVYLNDTISTTFENDREAQTNALVTWLLLGETNEIVTSEASSYGTTAASRTGKASIVCTHNKYCFRRLSSTPCQDTPWLKDQPLNCLKPIRQFPHQYLTSPENSCGFHKYQIYMSSQHQQDTWPDAMVDW